MPPMAETEADQEESHETSQDSIITKDEEFIPIGARGRPQWKFILTRDMTDSQIFKQGLGGLTNTVIQAEKVLKHKVQDVNSPLGPRDLAIRARNALKIKGHNPAQ